MGNVLLPKGAWPVDRGQGVARVASDQSLSETDVLGHDLARKQLEAVIEKAFLPGRAGVRVGTVPGAIVGEIGIIVEAVLLRLQKSLRMPVVELPGACRFDADDLLVLDPQNDDAALSVGEGDHLRAVTSAELARDAGEVALDRQCGQAEGLADLLVGAAVGDQAQDLDLAAGQLGDTIGLRAAAKTGGEQ